jgi:hypothetical protein
MRALKGEHSVPPPVDRGRPRSKHHLITDAHGFPLAVTLTGGHRHDVTQLIPLVAIPPAFSRNGAELRERRRLGVQRPPSWRRRQRSSSHPISPDPACLPGRRPLAAGRFLPEPLAWAGARPVVMPVMRR